VPRHCANISLLILFFDYIVVLFLIYKSSVEKHIVAYTQYLFVGINAKK